MHNLKIVIIFVAIVFTGFFSPGAPAYALSVQTLRFGAHGTGIRIVMDLDAEADFRAAAQDDPLRVVVDLPAIEGKPEIRREELPPLITDIRIEAVSGHRSRLSFILSDTAAIRTAFLIPASARGGARLVLDVNPVSRPAFTQQIGRPFGTLQAAGDLPAATPGKLPFAGIAAPRLAPISKPDDPKVAKPSVDTPEIPAVKVPNEKPLVVIDAGHGGVDPGASGSGVLEKDVTLSVAKDVRDALEATGKYRAELTRETDVFIPLAQRVRIARAKGADLFVSIHADSMPGATTATGASFYTLSAQASDAQAARLAARENQADLLAGIQLPGSDHDVAGILIDLAMRETTAQSKRFAAILVNGFKQGTIPVAPSPNRHAGFMVLKAPDVPSVLVELGFLSTPAEAQKLGDSAYRESLASTIAGSIGNWFETRKSR